LKNQLLRDNIKEIKQVEVKINPIYIKLFTLVIQKINILIFNILTLHFHKNLLLNIRKKIVFYIQYKINVSKLYHKLDISIFQYI
jgi:hypothetical protein